MTTIEDQIRIVVSSQAAAMTVPDSRPGEHVARITELPVASRRTRVPMLAAAAALVVVAGLALTQRGGEARQANPAAAGPGPFHFETPTVRLDAASLEVDVNGRTFVPGADLRVQGDPGMLNEYTTLELTWHDGEVEQRIFMYFRSDGADWWADEIRTYDGQADAEWVEPPSQGQYFKSPLGTAYNGDLDLGDLQIRGMTLQAFLRPSVCDNATTPQALLADFPQIDAPVGAFGATLQVLDTATCSPLAVDAFTFDYTSDDPSVAALAAQQNVVPGYSPAKTRVDLQLASAGATTIHVIARDLDGTAVGNADMRVVVRPTDGTVTSDTALPAVNG